MPKKHTEKAFENAIELHLTESGGYALAIALSYPAEQTAIADHIDPRRNAPTHRVFL
ncbi:MAG: hypothetical protein MPJ22_02725 [Pirellulales bacterium]|nr:hypothetical protein [Alphaproteobacteria bacterium]MDA8041322.1 hypothetical protein [Pirellulales bacterium]